MFAASRAIYAINIADTRCARVACFRRVCASTEPVNEINVLILPEARGAGLYARGRGGAFACALSRQSRYGGRRVN